MQIDHDRVNALQQFVTALTDPDTAERLEPADFKAMFEQHREQALAITPHEVFELFDHLLQAGHTADDLLKSLDKVFNVFYKGLNAYPWERPRPGSFLDVL